MKNFECVRQNVGQEFDICAKRNKPKCHSENKPYNGFGREL